MKKRIIAYIISIIIIIGLVASGLYIYKSKNTADKAKQQEQSQTKKINDNVITYKGKTGKTALVLLENNAKIITSGTGDNTFVTSINNVAANSKNQYWAFYINGKASTVGAGSYITKNSDTISWKLETF